MSSHRGSWRSGGSGRPNRCRSSPIRPGCPDRDTCAGPAAASRRWCACARRPAPRHRPAGSRHRPRQERSPSLRPGCGTRPLVLMAANRRGRVDPPKTPKPRASDPARHRGPGQPELCRNQGPVIRRAWPRCTIKATVAAASRAAPRGGGALARFDSAACAPCGAQRRRLLRPPPHAGPLIRGKRSLLDCEASGGHSDEGCSSFGIPGWSSAIAA